MFYFTPEGWKPFENKIAYKETKEVYDNDTEIYMSNTRYSEVEIAPVTLTSEQLQRLDTIKSIASIGVEDVRKYVLDGVAEDPQLIELQEAIRKNKLLSLIKWDELTEEEKAELTEVMK